MITKIEQFEDNKYIIADNAMNVDNSRNIQGIIYQKIIESISYNGTIDKSIVGIDNDKIELYVDPYIYQYVFKTEFDDIMTYKDGIFVLLSYDKQLENDCIWNLENKTIAYVCISDYLFIQALIKAYRLDAKKIVLKKLDPDELKSLDKIFDYCITYVTLKSKYMELISNSSYFINGFKDVDINRLKAFYPFIKENYNNMNYYFNEELIKNYVNSDNNVLIPIMNTIVIKSIPNINENFISRLNMQYDKISNNEKYSCYGNAKIFNNQYQCDSSYNIDGTPKTYYSLWDKRCNVNEDCPYYQANKNYPNKRGGCLNGFCEFPLGIKRLGFTKFDDANLNAPMCYECSDTTDIDCCKRMKADTQKTPDYVFDNDIEDRIKYNLKTTISDLDYKIYK